MIKEKNNKGQVGILLPFMIIGMVIVMVFFIVAIPVAYMNDEIIDAFQENIETSDSTNETIQSVQDKTTSWIDQTVFFVIISLIIGTIIISIFTEYHPVILGVLILVLILMVIMAGLFSNVTNEVSENDVLSEKASEFTFSNTLTGTQFPIVILILGIISFIIILSKRGGGVGA